MESRSNVKFSPNIRIDLEIDPKYEFGKTPPDQACEIFLQMVLMNEDLEKFFGRLPEVLRVQYYVDDLIAIDMKNPMGEVRAKRFSPCPWCQSTNLVVRIEDIDIDRDAYVGCNTCGIIVSIGRISGCYTVEDIIKHAIYTYNTRKV